MLSDPLAISYNGNSYDLPRISGGQKGSVFRTADEMFEMKISNYPTQRDSSIRREITLSKKLLDPTPGDVFDAFRDVRNTFGVVYNFDASRAGVSVDIPLLRTSLLALLDASFQTRIIAGER